MPKTSISEITSLSDQAIERVVRLHSGMATTKDEVEAREWQNRSHSHRKAFAEAEQLWLEMGDAWQSGENDPQVSAAVFSLKPPQSKRQWLAGMAACIALVSLAVQFSGLRDLCFSDYATGIGEHQNITLADGSRVLLNTDTALSIAFDDSSRRITLHRGQAIFSVVKDSARPFEVVTDTAVIKALGTVFEVLEDELGMRVTVEEHAVSVKGINDKNYAEAGRVSAGQQARYSPEHGLTQPVAVEPKQISAWRRGKLIFNNQAMGEVIAELDRYYPGRIVIVDDKLTALKISGVFPMADPAKALDMIADTLSVKITRITPWLTLIRA